MAHVSKRWIGLFGVTAVILGVFFFTLTAQTIYWTACPEQAALAHADDGDDLLLSIPPMLAAAVARSQLEITAPAEGDALTAGSQYWITWEGSSQSGIETIDIELSTEAGTIENERDYPFKVAEATSNDGVYVWEPVPFHDLQGPIQDCQIRITDSDNPDTVLAESDGCFSLQAGDDLTLDELEDYNVYQEGTTDSDSDGLYDHVELYLGTDPFHWDTDRDAVGDYYEVGLDYFDDGAPVPDEDADGKIAALDTHDIGIEGKHDGWEFENWDRDGDNIPNFLERYGFICDNASEDLFLPWDGDITKTYYKTDLLQPSTDQDQYSDYAEIAGDNMDPLVQSPADHPLIAAFPIFIVKLEDYTVTLNHDITDTNGYTHTEASNWNETITDTNSHTNEKHWEVGTEVKCGYSATGFSGEVSVSASYGESTSDTYSHSVAKSQGGEMSDAQSWSQATCTNPSEAAKIKIDLEVHNLGTCSARNIGFLLTLRVGGESIDTFDVELGEFYAMPPGDDPVALSYNDVSLTMNQLRALRTGAPISLDVSSISAIVRYQYKDGNGNWKWDDAGAWKDYFSTSEAVCARLFLDLGDGNTTEHLVYAGGSDWNEPVVTLRDALRWVVKGEDHAGEPMIEWPDGTLDDQSLDSWYFSLDDGTYEGISNYLQGPDFNLFDTVINPGSIIVAKAPPIYLTPEIQWAVLSPRDGTVTAYAEDYFFPPDMIKVWFEDKYGIRHEMIWNPYDLCYRCDCPANADGSDYFKDGTEKIIAQNKIYDPNETDPLKKFETEMPASEMDYVPSFDNICPTTNWCATPDRAMGVVVRESYAYVAADEEGLQVIDISDPSAPYIAATRDTGGYAYGITISGNYAYVADGSAGLQVINIENPRTPSVAVTCDTDGSARDVAVSGNYAYVADYDAGLQVINISDPENPVKPIGGNQGTCDIGSYTYAMDVAVSGNYAYVAAGSSGLIVIDIRTPNAPSVAGTCNTTGWAHGVTVNGNYAYVADGAAGLQVIDISDPENPEKPAGGLYDTLRSAGDVFIDEDNLYIIGSGFSVFEIDASDPANLSDIGASWPVEGTLDAVESVYVNNHTAYVAYSNGLILVDVADPLNPSFPSGAIVTEGFGLSVVVVGSYAYVSGAGESEGTEKGLNVVDVRDPQHPLLAGTCEWTGGGSAEGVAVSGDYAYVADGSEGFQVIDISDPENPVKPAGGNEGACDTTGSAKDVAVSGNYAYVADVAAGLQVIDISRANAPLIARTCDTDGYANGVTISGNYAYVAHSSGLQVIDISYPEAPSSVGTCNTTGYAKDVAVSGNYAYVADSSAGLQVIDINPHSNNYLTIVGSYVTTDLYASGAMVIGEYVYVADESSGRVHVLNVSQPTNPIIAESFETMTLNAYDVFVKENVIYVAGGEIDLNMLIFK